jgi:hypothetical protein
MKKILTIISLALCFCLEAQTNRTGTTSATGTFGGEFSLPTMVTTRFAQDHPNIAPAWSMEEDNYAGQYRDATTNLEHLVVYDRFGKLIREDVELEPSANPKAICSYYSKRFPEEKYVVWKSVDAKGKTTYYSKREFITICFDKKGKFVTTKDNKDKTEKKATQLTEKSK